MVFRGQRLCLRRCRTASGPTRIQPAFKALDRDYSKAQPMSNTLQPSPAQSTGKSTVDNIRIWKLQPLSATDGPPQQALGAKFPTLERGQEQIP